MPLPVGSDPAPVLRPRSRIARQFPMRASHDEGDCVRVRREPGTIAEATWRTTSMATLRMPATHGQHRFHNLERLGILGETGTTHSDWTCAPRVRSMTLAA